MVASFSFCFCVCSKEAGSEAHSTCGGPSCGSEWLCCESRTADKGKFPQSTFTLTPFICISISWFWMKRKDIVAAVWQVKEQLKKKGVGGVSVRWRVQPYGKLLAGDGRRKKTLREKEKCFRSFSAWIMWQPIKLYYPHVILPAVSEHRCGLTSVFRLFCHSVCGRGLFFGFHRDKCRRVCELQVSADTCSLLEIRGTNMLSNSWSPQSPWKQAQEIQQAETVTVLALWVSGLCVYY